MDLFFTQLLQPLSTFAIAVVGAFYAFKGAQMRDPKGLQSYEHNKRFVSELDVVRSINSELLSQYIDNKSLEKLTYIAPVFGRRRRVLKRVMDERFAQDASRMMFARLKGRTLTVKINPEDDLESHLQWILFGGLSVAGRAEVKALREKGFYG